MKRHPTPQPHTEGCNLVFEPRALVRPFHPDTDPILAPLAPHIEGFQGADDPLLETSDIGSHVRPPTLQIEHHIGHPLARAVIGELPAAPRSKHREAGVEQVTGLAAGARGIERGVFQQPHQFGRFMGRYRRDTRLHGRHGVEIGHRRVGNPPFDRATAGRAREGRQIEALAVVNHWLTITW